MILHLKPGIDKITINNIQNDLKALVVHNNGKIVLVTPSNLKALDQKYEEFVDEFFVSESDIQLAGKHYVKGKRQVRINNVVIGGSTNNTLMIAGPCSVESEEQIMTTARFIKDLGISTLRAGAFKPRTSPYSFQGLGLEGLKLLDKVRQQFGLNIITEVKDATHIEEVIEFTDIIQIGAKSMYDHGILRRCGKASKPVLLKRGFGTTIQEFVQAAEFILSGGNENVILCERGIRTFENKTRFTLDLCGAAHLKHNTNLPIVLDPSHAMGYAYGVPDLTRACAAMGVDGLLIETHPDPINAMSDAAQQLDFSTFRNLFDDVKKIAEAVGRTIV